MIIGVNTAQPHPTIQEAVMMLKGILSSLQAYINIMHIGTARLVHWNGSWHDLEQDELAFLYHSAQGALGF